MTDRRWVAGTPFEQLLFAASLMLLSMSVYRRFGTEHPSPGATGLLLSGLMLSFLTAAPLARVPVARKRLLALTAACMLASWVVWCVQGAGR